MDDKQKDRLFELADLILAISRHLHAAKADAAEPWTPLEAAVMRYIDHQPGATATQAAEATRLISSNFSRALRKLEQKGLVRREADPDDARRVRLYPTQKAAENLRHLQNTWSRLLDQAVSDAAEADAVITALRRIESQLLGRS
ncbi:MarR family winged helix-turn-helix transcriptional regulator [Streptantibioticus cattleyicolor]|uniref:Transcriptional regulator, MarR family protein n=1 Tax=Streptantibioticus cattleyicolor (strain ATCC 35852 / DSM 46488 / JCM 4925 / NBRC 14057 / NRRL 8057) TaxID=1003195 RepID=F8JLW2_STREN|nr:MarR family transcriptional regulator [Streptantibioticus cattleyicolor]AEW98231.1 transcriptional regulator, MarR family protein [Streptantibioticus cattleyicolor NRRL 8057 = DSM 46488]CCB72706.1 putative Transcriptional regulator [Streptantibioticus cattleyicolor NRRL 8057 = DSM 46488]